MATPCVDLRVRVLSTRLKLRLPVAALLGQCNPCIITKVIYNDYILNRPPSISIPNGPPVPTMMVQADGNYNVTSCRKPKVMEAINTDPSLGAKWWVWKLRLYVNFK